MSKRSKPSWPRIRKRDTTVKGNKYTYWVVDCGVVDGKRLTFNFKTSRDAEKKADELRRERNQIGIDALRLSDSLRKEAVKAFQRLDGQASLTEAIDFFLAHHNPSGGQRTVSELLGEYVESKKKANRRKRTIDQIVTMIGNFAREYGDTPVHKITTHDLEAWLDKHGYVQVTRGNFKVLFTGFFNYAMKRGLLKINPANAIERPTVDEKIPEVFSVTEAERLLRAAEMHDTRMEPYFAIALFAGVRPVELQQLDWSNVDLKSRRIRVVPETAKKRRQRYVDISDNLAAWLEPFAQEAGLVFFSRKAFDRVRRDGKIRWAGDICRHSYGSYHLAMHDNAALTSLQMGHRDTDVLFEHYRDLVTREDAGKYWSIMPESEVAGTECSQEGKTACAVD